MEDSLKLAQSIVGTNNDGGRPALDFYPTPEFCTQSLLDRETFNKGIWEPACGNGAMSDVLTKNGYGVWSTDIADYNYGQPDVDFLTCGVGWNGDIITNPPFKLAQEFVEKALFLNTRKCAFLCKLAFLEGKSRKAMFETTPLKTVYVFSGRVSMYRNGQKKEKQAGGMIAFAWFVWDKEYSGKPQLAWI